MSEVKGDFAAVYARHGPTVYQFALYLSGDPSEAEEIAAETFARAWTSRTPILNETVRSYLFTIARNVWSQRARRDARYETLDEGSAAGGMDERLEAREELRAVAAKLRELPALDRAALLMRTNGSDYDEIAAALGISSAAARVRVHRVRTVLMRARLGGTTP